MGSYREKTTWATGDVLEAVRLNSIDTYHSTVRLVATSDYDSDSYSVSGMTAIDCPKSLKCMDWINTVFYFDGGEDIYLWPTRVEQVQSGNIKIILKPTDSRTTTLYYNQLTGKLSDKNS